MLFLFLGLGTCAHATLDTTHNSTPANTASYAVTTGLQSVSLFPFTASFTDYIKDAEGKTVYTLENQIHRWYASITYSALVGLICIIYLLIICFDLYVFSKKGIYRKRIVSEVLHKYELKQFLRRPHLWVTIVSLALAVIIANGFEQKVSFVIWILQVAALWILIDRLAIRWMIHHFKKEEENGHPVEYPG